MKLLFAAISALNAAAAQADISCALTPTLDDAPSTLLIRETENEAIILVSGRTMVFECPPNPVSRAYECYGTSKPPIKAPTQLNVESEKFETGAVVVVSTRNLLFGLSTHSGTDRRHTSVRVYTIEECR